MTERRRPRQAAKGRGEQHTCIDPRVAEWGNPHAARRAPRGRIKYPCGAELSEVNHLSN